MLEIYNEEYKDLLAKRPAKGVESKKHNVVHDLTAGEPRHAMPGRAM